MINKKFEINYKVKIYDFVKYIVNIAIFFSILIKNEVKNIKKYYFV